MYVGGFKLCIGGEAMLCVMHSLRYTNVVGRVQELCGRHVI